MKNPKHFSIRMLRHAARRESGCCLQRRFRLESRLPYTHCPVCMKAHGESLHQSAEVAKDCRGKLSVTRLTWKRGSAFLPLARGIDFFLCNQVSAAIWRAESDGGGEWNPPGLVNVRIGALIEPKACVHFGRI